MEAAARAAFEAAERPEILGDAPAEMSLVLADDALVQTLNRDYRDKDKPTNVLSFALLDDLDDTDDVLAREQGMPILIGDVILAFETVQREAREQGKSVGDHLTHLVIHGVLHLLGYDHQSDPDADRMERLETSILARMGIADPYSANPAQGRWRARGDWRGRRHHTPTHMTMTDISGSRSPREDGADEQNSFTGQFRGWLRTILGGRGDTTLRDTIEELIEERREAEGSIAADERVLLANILKLHDRTVVDAMVPRADIVAVDIDTTLPALIERMSEEAHSRMPVYRETLDDVVGMVHIKDVLACIAKQKPFQMSDIVRDVVIVAPSMPVLDLLLQMRQSRQHMALVVDEFGGIDGLVTIEDLVEEIVGEIEDEHDEEEAPMLVTRPDGTLLADARLPIDEFLNEVGPVLNEEEQEDFDTLGGLVFSLAGRVPSRGELLKHYSGMEFEVVDADPRRIKRLRVRNLPEPAAAHA